MRSSSLLRTSALLAAAMLGVHQLRYALAYGGDAGHQLARQGHGYLIAVEPLVIAVLALALGQLLRSLAGGPRRAAGPARLRRRWASASAALLGAYVAQEWLEGALAAGHPAGPAGVAGHGGWLAVPLALAIGLLVALLVRGAELAVAAIRARPAPRWSPAPARLPVFDVAAPVRGLARNLAARGPPPDSV
jgi:hypothetical protein